MCGVGVCPEVVIVEYGLNPVTSVVRKLAFFVICLCILFCFGLLSLLYSLNCYCGLLLLSQHSLFGLLWYFVFIRRFFFCRLRLCVVFRLEMLTCLVSYVCVCVSVCLVCLFVGSK